MSATATVGAGGTAAAAGLLSCHSCGLLSRARPERARCPRCAAALHLRKPDSLARTTALLLASCILYVPANALPIMTLHKLGAGTPNTILSGVEHLIEAGLWSLAAIVFFASIAVPVLKILGIGYLAWSVRRGSRWRPRDRTRLYRVVESIGRWSMIDVFVISILVALVELGELATIETGPAATAFCGVVVLTMFAAASFDPRLVWDAMENQG